MTSPLPKRITDLFRAQFLFKLGVALIPFENFFFAPSAGWAALAPLAFFAYCIWNFRRLPQALANMRWVLIPITVLIGISSLNYFAHPPDPEIAFDVFRSLALGISFLFALDLYFGVHRAAPGPILKILCTVYWVSIALGVVQILAIHLEWQQVLEFLEGISKRSTLTRERAQFTFTEPSFISMHLFGVILPMAMIFRRQPEARQLLYVLGTFLALSFLTLPSLRLRVDITAVLLLCILLTAKTRRGWILSGIGALLVTMLGIMAYKQNERVQNVFDRGIYTDPSTGSRVLRFHASYIGHKQEPLAMVTGHGISNVWMPFRLGFAEARASFLANSDHGYDRELKSLQARNPSSLLSMPLRLLAEFGLVLSLTILALLFSRRHLLLYALMLYVYLPFDSYAFYTLWLYLYFVKVQPQLIDAQPRHSQPESSVMS